MYTTIFDKSLLLWFIDLTVILRGIVGKFCSRYCFDWQYYRHCGITLDRHHKTLYAITKGNAKNNELPSVCIVLISSLANINIIYAIDCSKIFFFVVWKKTGLQYSLVYWIFNVESVVNSILQLKANAIDLKRRWCLQSFVFYTTSLTNQFPAKSQL